MTKTKRSSKIEDAIDEIIADMNRDVEEVEVMKPLTDTERKNLKKSGEDIDEMIAKLIFSIKDKEIQ
jgi:hypothetical protein